MPLPVLIMLLPFRLRTAQERTVQLESQQIETLRFVIDHHTCREAAGIPDDDEPTREGLFQRGRFSN